MLPGFTQGLIGGAPVAPPLVPFDSNTKLMLHFDGTGNSPFVDVSPRFRRMQIVGGYYKAGPVKFGSGAGTWNGGAGDLLYCETAAPDGDLAMGTQPFTIDCWINISNPNGTFMIYDTRPNGTASGPYQTLYFSAHVLAYYTGGANVILGTTNLAQSVWYHVAVCRNAGVTKMYLNGVQEGPSYTDGTNYVIDAANRPVIGNDGSSGTGYAFNGLIDELRVSKYIARWTANFTPPTKAYGDDPINDQLTSLLCHFDGNGQSGSLIANDASLRRHGNATMNGTAMIGGSSTPKFGLALALDGTPGCSASWPNSPDWEFGNGSWTIDWWEYRLSSTDNVATLCRDPTTLYSSFLMGYASSGNLNFYATSKSDGSLSWDIANAVLMGAIQLGVWTHYAVVRSGNSFYTYQNGVKQGTATPAGGISLAPSSGPLSIGKWVGNTTANFYGFIDELRICKGTAKYTGQNFTPPTAPYPGLPITSPALMLHFDGPNATTNFYDTSYTRKGVGTVVGSVKADAISKIGPFAAWFFGAGAQNYIQFPASQDWAIDADYTIDCWVNITTLPPAGGGYFSLASVYTSATDSWVLCINESGGLVWGQTIAGVAFNAFGPSNIPTSQWYHVAFARNKGTVTLYVNGVGGTPVANSTSTSLAPGPLQIGAYATNNWYMRGYIDELRIVKGICDFTANFSSSLPIQAYPFA